MGLKILTRHLPRRIKFWSQAGQWRERPSLLVDLTSTGRCFVLVHERGFV
jgi:hypothetical protein